ncbi:MAG: YdcF family protein [bacterium]
MKNKKLWILNISIVLAFAFSMIYVLAVGNVYPLYTRNFFPSLETPPKTKIVMEPEGIVAVEVVRLDSDNRGELIVDFRALQKGETYVRVYELTDSGKKLCAERRLSVTLGNVILDQDFMLGKVDVIANFNGYRQVIFAIFAVLFLAEVIVLWSFIAYWRKGGFCYHMVACGGISIYLAVFLVLVVYKTANRGMTSFGAFVAYVAQTGILLFFSLVPIMLALSFLLMISNLWLIRHEGRRPANMLGIFFGILWFLGTVLVIGLDSVYTESWKLYQLVSVFESTLIFLIGYFECMFLSTVACAFLATKYRPAFDKDYIIILGCGINKDGTLKPLIRGRVDSALKFAKEQLEKTGKPVTFVPSGGKGPNEGTSESEAMARYLAAQGIPEERILREDQSSTTYENMKFSKKVIKAHGGDPANENLAFATTNYHVFRGYIMARKNGFDAKGISAKTKFYFFPNAFLREFVGLIVDRKWQHLAAVAVVLAFFLGIKYLL